MLLRKRSMVRKQEMRGTPGTPHSAKKGGKTPNGESESPKSGGLGCKSCGKSFNSDNGRQQHNKAKHDGRNPHDHRSSSSVAIEDLAAVPIVLLEHARVVPCRMKLRSKASIG
ncbi:hypothetical protein ACSQ67_016824 [Phaseolus vulgaris]